MRQASPTDFTVTVDGIGNFTFSRKTFRDQIAVESEYNRLTEGQDVVSTFLLNVASAVSELKVRTVAAPPAWENLDAIDPEDSETYLSLFKIVGALRDSDRTFREGSAKAVAGAG